MSMPESPTRRPVPPPKTESQARLREDLTSPGRQRNASSQHGHRDRPQSDALTPEVQNREATQHMTLPPGWNLKNEADVTYHTHVAKPVVHETIHRQKTEYIEPKITREYHVYHQYDYIQPLEVEIPNDSYVTNAEGEVIHAPGGLTTRVGQSSYWEQNRQDRGYRLPSTLIEGKDRDESDTEAGRDSVAGPFPIEIEGGGETVLHGIREGGIAQRFGGILTSPISASQHKHTSTAEEPLNRPRGGGFERSSPSKVSDPHYAPQTPPPGESFLSAHEDLSAPIPTRKSDLISPANLEPNFKRLSLQQHPEAKPLPALPDTSPRSNHSKSGVRRMSADDKLRDRFSMDSNRASLDGKNSMIDDEAVPDRISSVRKTRIY